MNTIARYFHTARHLRFIQVAARIRSLFYRPRIVEQTAPPLRKATGIYAEPIALAQSLISENVFRFLNVERTCADADAWSAPDATKLWLYNLHYFDDLNAVGSQQRSAFHVNLLNRWVAENPPGHAEGWEPYPTSRRIVNWIKWTLRGNSLLPTWRDSLMTQAHWLDKNVEYHILGNHLLANAKALIYAGLFFDGNEADRLLERGLTLVTQQLHEQVLPDGGHFELSPMYHAAALEDILDLNNLLRAYGRESPAGWTTTIGRMQHWLEHMVHPDGEIAFFNDAAFGIAPTLSQLIAYAARQGIPINRATVKGLVPLRDSGYVIASQSGVYLVCDCAQVGPPYLPGHAHADTLSFEVSFGRQRVFVNSGTSVYGSDSERQRQRGTAAHNTIVVDSADSSDVWAGFRVARRAIAKLISADCDSGANLISIEASHDGYRRLPGRVEHRRCWILGRNALSVEDYLSGECASAEARFHLHPEIEITPLGPRSLRLSWSGGGGVTVSCSEGSSVDVMRSTWHPQFGKSIDSRCIVVRFSGNALVTKMEWDKV